MKIWNGKTVSAKKNCQIKIEFLMEYLISFVRETNLITSLYNIPGNVFLCLNSSLALTNATMSSPIKSFSLKIYKIHQFDFTRIFRLEIFYKKLYFFYGKLTLLKFETRCWRGHYYKHHRIIQSHAFYHF